jgi:threonyl-tRNA synthetase
MESHNLSLSHKRHTLAHLLAAATLEHFPHAQLTLGPAIETGFYYDIDFGSKKPNDDDLVKIQETMKILLKTWTEFSHKEVSQTEAKEIFAGNIYKNELIDEISEKGEVITLYTCGNFTDLCRGGHCENPSLEIDAESFMLEKIAGAYWRGDETKPMLTRIYGLAFETKEELEQYKWQVEEAKKRDHRILGPQLGIYTLSPLVGSGLPLFKPKGAMIRKLIEEYLWELHENKGYDRVWTPHLAKEALYETSGHLEHYKENMFFVEGAQSKEHFCMKPMSCPHHMQIFADNQFSYRDMPVRYFEPATIYRDEKSGQLSGLTRVRSITQDDGHLFCRATQLKTEMQTIVEIIKEFFTTFGMTEGYKVRLSVRDETDNWLGSDEVWEVAEAALTQICEEQQLPYFVGKGEAAFYGPKLDFMFYDAIGREWQLSTIQVDFNLPERFNLSFINELGEKERPVVIHRAISGSLERFIGVMIEHFAGSFPLWLSPMQVSVLPVSSEKHGEYAQKVFTSLKEKKIRAEICLDDTLGKRIRESKTSKIPYQIVIGDKECESDILTVEGRNNLKLEIGLLELCEKLEQETKERAL